MFATVSQVFIMTTLHCSDLCKACKFLLQVTIDNVGDVLDVFLFIQHLFCVFRFPQVVQKHTLGEVGT